MHYISVHANQIAVSVADCFDELLNGEVSYKQHCKNPVITLYMNILHAGILTMKVSSKPVIFI